MDKKITSYKGLYTLVAVQFIICNYELVIATERSFIWAFLIKSNRLKSYANIFQALVSMQL